MWGAISRGMSKRKRTGEQGRGIRHRLRPKLRRRRARRTYVAGAVVDSHRCPLRVDERLWHGFLYTVGVHARNPSVALHDLSFDGLTYWLIYTADPGNGAAFVEAIARDFGDLLRACAGDDELTILREPPITVCPPSPLPRREVTQP